LGSGTDLANEDCGESNGVKGASKIIKSFRRYQRDQTVLMGYFLKNNYRPRNDDSTKERNFQVTCDAIGLFI